MKEIKKIEFTTNLEKLKKDLISIKTDLIILDFLLKPLFFSNYFFNNESINNANHLIKWTEYFINYWINLLIIYDWIHNLITQKWPENVMYSELIKNVNPILSELKNDINNSFNEFLKIKNLEDKDLSFAFSSKINLVKTIKDYTNTFIENIDVVWSILADQKKKTYLIVFQNNDEIRPTWWFIWSVWFLDVFKWKIIKFEKKDIYALEWQIKGIFNEIAPEWLNKITPTFGLRDANYYPDIKESSEKIKYFLDKSEYKIDWIIYVNQNVILDFLKNFWWIYFDKVGRVVTSENFSMIISTLVEAKITKTHTLATPKQILFDFIDVYINELKKAWKYSLYIKTIFDSIEKRDIMFYSFYDDENKFLEKLWLKKDISFDNYLDFNYPVFTSIWWNKSDRYIKRSFIKEIKKNDDCSYTTKLKIFSKHTFDIWEEINIKNFLYDMDLLGKIDLENTLTIQWKRANKQYVRLLLPENAIIKENEKIKITVLNWKKQVSFYFNTPLLYPSEFNIEYKIPNKDCKSYNYLFIKQPWIKEYKLNIIKDWNLLLDSYLDRDFSLK